MECGTPNVLKDHINYTYSTIQLYNYTQTYYACVSVYVCALNLFDVYCELSTKSSAALN